jgi:ComF family protein
MLTAIINLLYPAVCQVCFKKTDVPSQFICKECFKKIKKRLPPFCIKCGKQLNGDPASLNTCPDCKKDMIYFDRAWSACCYEGILKELVHKFKYKKITCLTKEFTSLVTDFMQRYNAGIDAELIMSIPMHPKRLFKRELNHSDILAKDIARRLGVPYSNTTLKKIKDTKLQSELKRQERIKNLSKTFSVTNKSMICNKHVLLVDDLFTTGSTANECAKELKEAGAKYVEIITLARGDTMP